MLGLALVAASAALIPRGAHFPGPVALFPVAAALLVILSGLGSHRNRLLASRPLVFIGGMSFTLYLWHWPLLVFYRELFNAGTVGLVPGLLIILLSFGLSYLTKTLVESPTLLIPRRKAVSGYVIGALFLAPVATLASFYRSELNQIQSSVMVALEKGRSPLGKRPAYGWRKTPLPWTGRSSSPHATPCQRPMRWTATNRRRMTRRSPASSVT